MNHISKLSDSNLLIKTKFLVVEEKRITQEVLNHLEEIEYRKLYLARGYSSLFEYCVKELGYSESSAHRRISAMRVIKIIPEAKEKLNEGLVNLSTLTQLHGFLKREEKEKTYTTEMKLDLLEKIEGKSQDQCEREFIKISPLEITFKEKERPITEDLTQITFVASKDLMAKLEVLRNLLAHKNSNATTAELIELLADLALKKLNPTKCIENELRGPKTTHVEEKAFVKHKFTSAAEVIGNNKLRGGGDENKESPGAIALKAENFEVTKGNEKSKEENNKRKSKGGLQSQNASRYIPASLRRSIWKRDQGFCQYLDKETNKKCQSQFALQIDHVHPFSLGGNNKEENLRLLCRSHNNWRTKELFSLKFQ